MSGIHGLHLVGLVFVIGMCIVLIVLLFMRIWSLNQLRNISEPKPLRDSFIKKGGVNPGPPPGAKSPPPPRTARRAGYQPSPDEKPLTDGYQPSHRVTGEIVLTPVPPKRKRSGIETINPDTGEIVRRDSSGYVYVTKLFPGPVMPTGDCKEPANE